MLKSWFQINSLYPTIQEFKISTFIQRLYSFLFDKACFVYLYIYIKQRLIKIHKCSFIEWRVQLL